MLSVTSRFLSLRLRNKVYRSIWIQVLESHTLRYDTLESTKALKMAPQK